MCVCLCVCVCVGGSSGISGVRDKSEMDMRGEGVSGVRS